MMRRNAAIFEPVGDDRCAARDRQCAVSMHPEPGAGCGDAGMTRAMPDRFTGISYMSNPKGSPRPAGLVRGQKAPALQRIRLEREETSQRDVANMTGLRIIRVMSSTA